MRIVWQQTILMKYHSLFVIFWKFGKIWYCRLLQFIGGALWVKSDIANTYATVLPAKSDSDFMFWCKVIRALLKNGCFKDA